MVTFKPVPVRRPDYYMTAEQALSWLGQLERRPDPVYRNLGTLMVLTGLRMGEAAGLCWDTGTNPRSRSGYGLVLVIWPRLNSNSSFEISMALSPDFFALLEALNAHIPDVRYVFPALIKNAKIERVKTKRF